MQKSHKRQDKPERGLHTNLADKPQERLSYRELEEMMGTKQDTYIYGGAGQSENDRGNLYVKLGGSDDLRIYRG